VLPGRILVELIDNDRVIGGITPRCARKALQFYRRFVRGACVTTQARAAEMTKLVENAFRDVNIAFANELSVVGGRAWGSTSGKSSASPTAIRASTSLARPGCRRPLHRGRSLVPRPLAIPSNTPSDPHRARGQRRQGRAHHSPAPRR
jgi:hypothetical protein